MTFAELVKHKHRRPGLKLAQDGTDKCDVNAIK